MSNTTQSTEPRCGDCGGRARVGQSFCDDCGAFLSWDGQATAEAAPAQPANQPAGGADQPAATRVDQPAEARAEQPAPAPQAPAAAAAAPPVSIDKSSETVPNRTVAPPVGAAAEDDTTEVLTEPIDPASPPPPPAPVAPEVARARALLVPVADPSRAAQHTPEVAPVLPGTPSAARPTVRRPGDEEHTPYGDACPWCGTANQPERHFCRRCAMRLAETPGGPQRRPWWRRMLDFRGREAPWAGERPRLRRDLGRIVRWTLTVAVVAALVVTISMEAAPATHAVEDHFASRAQIHDFTMSASHSSSSQPASQANDGYNNTAWGSGYGGDNTGQWLKATFTSPQHLLNVIITPCAGSESDLVSVEACPAQLAATITDNSGKVHTQQLNLDDGQPQTFNLDYRDVVSVQFSIVSLYGASPQKQAAIAEVEFFGPSAS